MKPSAPLLALHQLSLYNTGRMTTEQVIAAFAARQPLLERILADLGAEKKASRAQHHLIVGQRGMGKTMLLARIAAELRRNSELASRFVPLVFAEEQYAVDRLSKFWLNCLDSLADARELAKDTAAVAMIDATVARLSTSAGRSVKEDQPFADEVYLAFAKAAEATGQRPVLLVDNLQIVFERLDSPQQHSLRELLMRPGAPIVIGASPSPPPQTQDYGAAFYDHFKVHYLRPLEEGEMRDLLVHLADAAERDDVRQRVLQHPARLKVLRQLTGGNPRTTLTLFFLYAEDFAPSVFGDLEGLLDRVTPLYKARFEELTAQQQVITSAIANHWDPVTAAQLVAATALPAGTLSAQLDRLEKAGTLERVELFGESRTGYQLAERFFNIWFLMRSASRRQRREVEFLTRFLESFYEPQDRARLARQLISEDRMSADRYLWSCAVQASLSEPASAEELKRHTDLLALRERAAESRTRLHELIDFDALPPATLAFDALRQRLAALVPDNAPITPQDFAKAVLGNRGMFMKGSRERLASRVRQLTTEEIQGALNAFRTDQAADVQMYSESAVEWLTHRLGSGQLRHWQDFEDWKRAFHQANQRNTFQLMLDTIPDGFGARLDDNTFELIRSHLEPIGVSDAWQWAEWGYDLHAKLLRYAEAEAAYRMAVAYAPNLGGIWYNLGVVLANHLHRYAEAEIAFSKAIALNPNDAQLYNGLGNLYCDFLNRPEDAARAFGRAIEIAPHDELSRQNQIFVRRDFLGEGATTRPLMQALLALPNHKLPDSTQMHEALFAAYDANWGLTCEALSKAIHLRQDGFSWSTTDDWLRASAVLLHLNYGAELLIFLDQLGDTTARLRPWVEALRALQIGDRRALQNIAPEIRVTAEVFYDGIESRLLKLPEKTRRRPTVKPKRTRSRRT